MTHHGPDLISGWKTVQDWQKARSALAIGGDNYGWRNAFEDFFRTRLELRYLSPIRVLQEHGTLSGEGFSIAAIQCSLIEFLESTFQGIKYRYVRDPSQLGPYEYSSSSGVFVNFLTKRLPFANQFSSDVAKDFYGNVRCGLLHEARTKGGWRIWATDPGCRIIDSTNKLLFRDNFQEALLAFVEAYGRDLETTPDYQAAFIRKFDDLCT